MASITYAVDPGPSGVIGDVVILEDGTTLRLVGAPAIRPVTVTFGHGVYAVED